MFRLWYLADIDLQAEHVRFRDNMETPSRRAKSFAPNEPKPVFHRLREWPSVRDTPDGRSGQREPSTAARPSASAPPSAN